MNINQLSEGYLGNGVNVNGADQWVDFGSHQDRCFGNTSHCNYGFAFAFWVMFGSKADVPSSCQFVFTSADVQRANSYEVCWRDGKLRISVTTDKVRDTKMMMNTVV